MFTVALIGSDGAGKTTVGRDLERRMPHFIKYIYMGINVDASNLLLPTTRLLLKVRRAFGKQPDMGGPPDPARVKPRPKGVVGRTASGLKAGLRLLNRLGEEWFRQVVAWIYLHRGYVVLFDRHFYSDYYAHDIVAEGTGRSLSSRIHGLALQYLYPKPDLIILLDAPAELLYARKGEGTPALLERRRREYLQLQDKVENFAIVDASQGKDAVTQDVMSLIQSFFQSIEGNYQAGEWDVPS